MPNNAVGSFLRKVETRFAGASQPVSSHAKVSHLNLGQARKIELFLGVSSQDDIVTSSSVAATPYACTARLAYLGAAFARRGT